MIVGLDHVQLAMPEGREDEARRFYGGVLGLAEVTKPPHLPGGCWFTAPGFQLHLGIETPFRPACKAHPALRVADLATMRARLGEAGVAFVEGKPLEGYLRGDIADPFGNRIELMERL